MSHSACCFFPFTPPAKKFHSANILLLHLTPFIHEVEYEEYKKREIFIRRA
jgi:hypothetical protein